MAKPFGLKDFQFTATVRIHNKKRCSLLPSWWANKHSVSQEFNLSFENVILSAGIQFANSLNRTLLRRNQTARQRAADIAWAIISCSKPRLIGSGLIFEHVPDQDIIKLVSELVSVGAGIELMCEAKVIRSNSIKKSANLLIDSILQL